MAQQESSDVLVASTLIVLAFLAWIAATRPYPCVKCRPRPAASSPALRHYLDYMGR